MLRQALEESQRSFEREQRLRELHKAQAVLDLGEDETAVASRASSAFAQESYVQPLVPAVAAAPAPKPAAAQAAPQMQSTDLLASLGIQTQPAATVAATSSATQPAASAALASNPLVAQLAQNPMLLMQAYQQMMMANPMMAQASHRRDGLLRPCGGP